MARAPSKKKVPTKTKLRTEGRSVVDEITDHIAFEIASGVRPPGERLSSVRGLATTHGINPSTVQIVLARLRAAGFVDAGFIVRDIEVYGGIDTWRYLFRFAQRMPERATKIFEGFLSTRRVLVLEVARTIVKAPHRFDLRALERAVERLETLARTESEPEVFARAELQAARVFMVQADQPVLLALYNTIAEILLTVPAVIGAMYADPSFNVAMWRNLLEGWQRGAAKESDLERASNALAQFHVACVARFRALLEERASGDRNHPRSRTTR